ncbi:MAG: DUF1156 domain-containing protein [Gammaproteobacteria bacterium]|nr:DUF1156 domain-containing protein [Gammaproteobacteria bacterium]
MQRKKLIEVSLPLEAINAASAREKSIRHGHPSTLHLWWARRPLAACRAVLFAQLVDDPSAWPDEFQTEEEQAKERERLHEIIKDMVPWKATNDEDILGKARYEIARSIARGRDDAPPQRDKPWEVLEYLAEYAPPVCDPFCGGGSIPLEAQRLGLRAHGSDLNPVAVLVSKATCEIPPKFAGRAPVNPERDRIMSWKGTQGLAEDIRYYGRWMREQAESHIGHLYPKVLVTKEMVVERDDLTQYTGQELTVIAWLWARTVASPDPMMRGAHVPLVRSFVLSSKKRSPAWVEPEVNRRTGAFRFAIRSGANLDAVPEGTISRKGGRCLVTGSPMPFTYIRNEGKAGRITHRLMAVVAEGARGRVYLNPTSEMEEVARSASPSFRPDNELPHNPRDFKTPNYGMSSFADLFTNRQLVALTTFSDLVAQAREKVLSDARDAAHDDIRDTVRLKDTFRLADGGTSAQAYADAVATYLGLCVSRQANRLSNLSFWHTGGAKVEQVFARQALPMVWDFCEANPLSGSSGNFVGQVDYLANVVANSPAAASQAAVIKQNAAGNTPLADQSVIATDPPYYDNIGYADLSDFFYVWLRQALADLWPELFRRVLVPKEEELVATPYRHGGKAAAEKFFMDGMKLALANLYKSGLEDFPITMYYAFKQSEFAKEGLTSAGWATFLQGLADSGFEIDGTWPVRTELADNLKKRFNALSSSIVLVCRKRQPNAEVITRREFVARLRSKLPDALSKIRDGGIGPVDMAQASLGPGMGVFTAVSKVLEPDDTPMTVRTAIALINQIRDEISGEEASGYDANTRFCIDWFDAFGMEKGKSGDAITMAQAYNVSIEDLEQAGVVQAHGGSVHLLRREEMPADWDPSTDQYLTDWECVQHLARALNSPAGGVKAAAKLYAHMPPERGEAARMLAYRLYDICEKQNRAAEAQVWNMLAREWPALEAAAAEIEREPQLGRLF